MGMPDAQNDMPRTSLNMPDAQNDML